LAFSSSDSFAIWVESIVGATGADGAADIDESIAGFSLLLQAATDIPRRSIK